MALIIKSTLRKGFALSSDISDVYLEVNNINYYRSITEKVSD